MAIVTIGGNIGAGKTMLTAKLAPALGYENLYVGGIFRAMADERGVSIDDFYASLAGDPELERTIDERQGKLMQEKSDLVVQGRIAWYFAKKNGIPALNVLLSVDPRTGAERKMKQGSYPGKSIEETAAMCRKREEDESGHYRSLYGILNHQDPAHYDIVLDTSRLTEDEVFQKILAEISKRTKK